jgi:argininosuccinate lyase
MLGKIGVLSTDELDSLFRELALISEEARQGAFHIEPAEEDGHTAIENRLTEQLGEAGRKIHTGRSRNDQVIAALRLWGRQSVLDQIEGVTAVAARLLELAEEHRETTVPGYTHTRQAMPSTMGHLFGAWGENLIDDIMWLETAFHHLNRSPLGSASGFGVGLALDRQLVSDLLGFARLQVNTLSVQNDRGKSEYLALAAAAATATDLGRLASDLIWYSSEAFGFIRLPTSITTGSSIMPQKRNPDVLELIRAAAARLRSRQGETGAVYGGLTAGYHRDLQLTKEPFLEGMTSLVDILTALLPVLDGMTIDAERCRASVLPATVATDAVYARVEAGVPFRDAYREQASAPPADGTGPEDINPEAWRHRAHSGAPADMSLGTQKRSLAEARNRLARMRSSIDVDLLRSAPRRWPRAADARQRRRRATSTPSSARAPWTSRWWSPFFAGPILAASFAAGARTCA